MLNLFKLIFASLCFPNLVGCISPTYFPKLDLTGDYTQEEFVEWYAPNLKIMQEPSLWEMSQEQPHIEQYRILVVTDYRPVHSIRLKIKSTGNGTAIVKKMNIGAGAIGRMELESSAYEAVSEQQVENLRKLLGALEFWDSQIADPLSTDKNTICLHPTMFVFEAVKDGMYKFQHESTCVYTNFTHQLLPFFYKLGRLGPEMADWSLVEYFEKD